jgi:hypothetical protein
MAQLIYIVNPHADIQGIPPILDQIMKSSDEEVILRISENTGSNITLSDLNLKQTAIRKVLETSETEYPVSLPFIGNNSTRDAVVELLKSDQDLDISLPTGYTIFQIDHNCLDVNEIGVDCFIDTQNLLLYLKSLGAQHTHRDETTRWKGMETIIGEMKESTLTFETEYRDLKMTKANALIHLRAASVGRFETPDVIKMSDVKKSRLFVIANDTCEISLIKNHELSTVPMSKQRLLYLFDCFKEWLRLNEARWITMYFQSFQKFQYKLDRIKGWDIPKKSVSATNMVKSLHFLDTALWGSFYNANTIQERFQAMLSLLDEYGFAMDLTYFSGSSDDYVSNRMRYRLPQRTQVVRTIVAESDPFVYGRGRGRARLAIPAPKSHNQNERSTYHSYRSNPNTF